MRTWLPVFLVALAAIGCGSPGESAAPDGLDTASADTISSGAARTRGFVTPALTQDETAAVLARYAFVDPEHTIEPGLLRDALVYYDANRARLTNKGHVGIVNYSIPDTEKRFDLIDMSTGAVITHAVAHGEGSDDGAGHAVKFSNVDGSHQSSLGFILTGEIYSGSFGRSLRLDGLSPTNSNLRLRAVVMHGKQEFHEEGAGVQSKSQGCLAMDFAVKDDMVTALANGALVFTGVGPARAE